MGGEAKIDHLLTRICTMKQDILPEDARFDLVASGLTIGMFMTVMLGVLVAVFVHVHRSKKRRERSASVSKIDKEISEPQLDEHLCKLMADIENLSEEETQPSRTIFIKREACKLIWL